MKIIGAMTYLKEQANRKVINVPKFIDVMLTEIDRIEEADAEKRKLIISGRPLNEINYFSAKGLASEIEQMMQQTERPIITDVEQNINLEI